MIDRVENASARHGESWRLINEITGRKAAKTGILKGSEAQKTDLKSGANTSAICWAMCQTLMKIKMKQSQRFLPH